MEILKVFIKGKKVFMDIPQIFYNSKNIKKKKILNIYNNM